MATNEIIIKKIVYGSIAYYLGKKSLDNDNNHKWCVYVNGANNEDISSFVKEVTFTLHNSFPNHIRTVSKAPFHLYEIGWGEFALKIQIHLIDETMKPLELTHYLKLHPNQQHIAASLKKPVVSENYDEIIFVNPKKSLRANLLKSASEMMDIDEEVDDDINKKEVKEEDTMEKDGTKNADEDQEMMGIEKKSELTSSNQNNNTGWFHSKSHYLPIDDTAHLKQLEDDNNFVTREISIVKEALLEKEKEIAEIKRLIKEYK